MKKLILIAAAVFFTIFGGFGSGERGWALALKRYPSLSHVYTDFDNIPISRHYARIVVGYDSRANFLIFWQKIN